MRVTNLKVATHLRPKFVVLALTCFEIEPDTWFAKIDIGEPIDMLVDLKLQRGRKSLPMRIVVLTIELRMPNGHTTSPALVAVENRKR